MANISCTYSIAWSLTALPFPAHAPPASPSACTPGAGPAWAGRSERAPRTAGGAVLDALHEVVAVWPSTYNVYVDLNLPLRCRTAPESVADGSTGGKARGRKPGAAAAGASGSSRGGPASPSWRSGAGAPRGAAKGGSCGSGARARCWRRAARWRPCPLPGEPGHAHAAPPGAPPRSAGLTRAAGRAARRQRRRMQQRARVQQLGAHDARRGQRRRGQLRRLGPIH